MNIKIRLNPSSVEQAIRQIEDYQKGIEQKAKELCRRLAQYGLILAEASFGGAAYDGIKDVYVDVVETEKGYKIVASGDTVLILEFGAGVTLGYGHPQADEFGMGPGTYPGQVNAMNPWGWWYADVDGSHHTWGNPPSMTMYNTAKDLRREVEAIAREVFKT